MVFNKKRGKRNAWALFTGVILSVASMSFGCGENANNEERITAASDTTQSAVSYSGVTITVAAPEESAAVINEGAADFQRAFPRYADAEIIVEAAGEDETAADILADLSGTADVFFFRQDMLSSLVKAGALEKPDDEEEALLRERDSEAAINAASIEGDLCAYPVSIENGYFLYYDSSVIDDPGDLDSILSACEAAGRTFCMELNSGWYQTAFFFGTGCTLSYDTDTRGNFISCDIDYASDEGVEALMAMIRTTASTAFVNSSSAGAQEGYAAIVDGLWDEEMAESVLGENMACAKLPSFTGTDGQTHEMSGFADYRLLGVRAGMQENKSEVCAALAGFLTESAVQEQLFDEAGWCPVSTEVQESDKVRSDDGYRALMEQMKGAVPRGRYPVDYWSLATALGDDVLQGNLSQESSKEELLAALESFQDTCISYARGTD